MGTRASRTPHPAEPRERAVRMVREHREAHGSQWSAIGSIAAKIGCHRETARGCGCARPSGTRARGPGPRARSASASGHSGARSASCVRPTNRRSARELRDPAQGVGVFRDGGARPPIEAMIAFVDDHRAVHGVEPICRPARRSPRRPATPTSPSDASRPGRPPAPGGTPSCAPRSRACTPRTSGSHGVRKVWRQLGREGVAVARCTVERLMRAMGLRGPARAARP